MDQVPELLLKDERGEFGWDVVIVRGNATWNEEISVKHTPTVNLEIASNCKH